MGDGGVVTRERLLARLDAAAAGRLTLVVADAGFGKTELLEQWLRSRRPDAGRTVRPHRRDLASTAGALVDALREQAPEDAARVDLAVGSGTSEPELLAGMLGGVLAGLPRLELLLVIDDAQLLPEPTVRFVASLLRHAPPTLHLLVLSRQELPFPTDRLPDPVQRLDGADLGFDDDELAELVRAVVGDDEHAAAVRALLGRWPAAVRMAAEKLASVPADRRTAELLRLKTHGARGLVALAQEVLAAEPPRNRRLAQVVAPFDAFSAELAEELGCSTARESLEELVSRGIVVRLGVEQQIRYYAFPRLLREFTRANLPLGPAERPELVRRAGAWFERHGQPEGALRCAIDQQDSAWVARLLRAHGRALVERGRRDRVERGLALVAAADRDSELGELSALLAEVRGDHAAALELYRAATAARGDTSPWVAYRIGFLHYFRGDLDAALAAFRSAQPAADAPERSVLLAWQATVLWAKGEPYPAQELASAALDLAESLGDAGALAAAHTVVAMLHGHRGERAESHAHYDLALQHAERAGDVLQVVRIRNNRSAMLLEESELRRALPEAEAAIELAQAAGLPFYLSAALTNRGQIRFHQGQYDAAAADLEKARRLDRAAGTSSSATRIWLGHVHRHRGHPSAARTAYEEVLAAGRSTHDATLLVPALSGLAVVLAESEPQRARQLVEEALSYDAGVNGVTALNAAAWVASAQGRPEDAVAYAERAQADAASRRDRLGEAEALHLLAACDPAGRAADAQLARAAALLADIGAPVWQARVRLEQAWRQPSHRAVEVVAEIAELAAALGARSLAEEATAGRRALRVPRQEPGVEVSTLGGFRVRRAGAVLSLADWGDGTAAELLKRLTAVPTQSWTRGALQRSLWPGEPAEKAQLLLDEAVRQLRATLDPTGALDRERYVVARGDTVALHGADVDVRLFLADSAAGLAGNGALLSRAETRYTGDYLEEHPGEPWAAGLREEARNRYVEVARALAASALAGDQPEAAARYSRRILERDPYDERAHLSLVAALSASGRSQEARSCYASYAARLDELGLEAVPWTLAQDSRALPLDP